MTAAHKLGPVAALDGAAAGGSGADQLQVDLPKPRCAGERAGLVHSSTFSLVHLPTFCLFTYAPYKAKTVLDVGEGWLGTRDGMQQVRWIDRVVGTAKDVTWATRVI